ncbi:hypothetical protein BDN72DRAFT_788678 [Pluteus cervinus]|uniref:Uncharacterized protein n=1 Tax=Pluteus cervinus TaxID=181527 RepID=A0ACD3BC06_9AGAR|nr:hypothetical protein BDN72DRAFT_788678 [Pluteus cervinus]
MSNPPDSESPRATKQKSTYGSADSTLVEQIGAMPTSKNCLSCRIVGSGTFAGVGAYALWQSRAAAPGTPAQKRIVAGLGVALCVGSVIRWLQ